VYQFLGNDSNYTTAMGQVNLNKGDTVRLQDGYGHGGVAGELYSYSQGNPPPAKLDLGEQDYSTGPWAPVTANLDTENYSDTSRWMKLTTITATSVAASIGVAGSPAVAVGVSGAGAEATNIILTKTDAYAQDSNLTAQTTAGDVHIKAQST